MIGFVNHNQKDESGRQGVSVIAFLWAVCSDVGKAELVFQNHNSLTSSERTNPPIVTSGPSAHIACSPVEAPVFKVRFVSYPRGEARRIFLGNIFQALDD